jgi:hypothetical protein
LRPAWAIRKFKTHLENSIYGYILASGKVKTRLVTQVNYTRFLGGQSDV